jgi:hypothetical protein
MSACSSTMIRCTTPHARSQGHGRDETDDVGGVQEGPASLIRGDGLWPTVPRLPELHDQPADLREYVQDAHGSGYGGGSHRASVCPLRERAGTS